MRNVKYLNYDWLYKSDYKDEYLAKDFKAESFESVDIPHTNKELPFNCFDERDYVFESTYIKKIFIKDEYQGKKLFLDFEGVMIYADVFCNGKLICSHKGGYTFFEVDITEFVNYGQDNTIVVKVDSTERKDIPPYGNVVDYLTYGGIYREVSLRVVEKSYVKNLYIKTLDCLEKIKKVSANVVIEAEYDCDMKIEFNFTDELMKNQIESKVVNAKKGENKVILDINTENVELWNINNPKLYEAFVRVSIDSKVIDNVSEKFGFREAIFKCDGFYLNGEKIKLIGLNRHQSYPYVGYAMPKRIQEDDAKILKNDLGINIVRCSHYPQSKHFLNKCDELGLLVFEEIPGWQHIGDEEWKQVAIKNVREMIERDFNHPSIILWGVRINESDDCHDLYQRTNDLAHLLDDTRQTGGVRYVTNSEMLEDVLTFNDFVHEGGTKVLRELEEVTDKKVPYLVTENNGHIFPTKIFDCESRIVEHAHRHLSVINEAMLRADLSGNISWCAFDYNTHSCFGSGDKICYHGVLDMFRIPKYAAYSYASQKDISEGIVLEVLSNVCRGEKDKAELVPFDVFTNCDFIKVYKNGKFVDKFSSDENSYKGLKHKPIKITHLETKENQTGDCTWGDISIVLDVEGYIDGKKVISKKVGEKKFAKELVLKVDNDVLECNGDSYDATRIEVNILDNLGTKARFINDVVSIDVEGPIELIGPSMLPLQGGATAFWVRTKRESGTANIKVKSNYFESEATISIVEK